MDIVWRIEDAIDRHDDAAFEKGVDELLSLWQFGSTHYSTST
jgi:hypothetical protein